MHFQLLLILCAASPTASGPALLGPANHRLALRTQSVATDQASVLPEPQANVPSPAMAAPMAAPGHNIDAMAFGGMAAPGMPVGSGVTEPTGGESVGGTGDCQSVSHGAGCGHGFCGAHSDPATHMRCRAAWNLSPGNMYPWAPYYPEYHGDYYFRPYHWTQVFEQQRIASRWGADPRMPYASSVFQSVYAELGIPEAPGLEQLPPPNGAKKRPCDYFESVKCGGYSR
jgi:hypothetical protein